MSKQYQRLLKLRRWRELQRTLQANQILEQLRATEKAANNSRVDEQTPEPESSNPASTNVAPTTK